jgi:hypothetical protein
MTTTLKPRSDLAVGDVLLKPDAWGRVAGPATVTSVVRWSGDVRVTWKTAETTGVTTFGSGNDGVWVVR